MVRFFGALLRSAGEMLFERIRPVRFFSCFKHCVSFFYLIISNCYKALEMPKVVQKNQQAKRSKMNSLKKFSKVRLFQLLGLLARKFNSETLEFEPSWPLRVWFVGSLLSKSLFEIKLFVSNFFARNSRTQLFIGSLFNYTADRPKFFIGLVVCFKAGSIGNFENHLLITY